jgi:hypothetical protein
MLLVHVELHPCLADASTRHQVPCRVDEREYDTQNIFIDIHDDQIPNGTTLELAAQYWPELSYLPTPPAGRFGASRTSGLFHLSPLLRASYVITMGCRSSKSKAGSGLKLAPGAAPEYDFLFKILQIGNAGTFTDT